MDGMLSQEEINALLGGMDTDVASDAEEDTADAGGQNNSDTVAGNEETILTPEEKDAIGEVANISMGTAATTLFSLLNNVVDITVPQVSYANWDDLVDSYDRPCVFVQLSYIEGIEGNNILILKERDVKIITDLMMGGDGQNTDDELSDLHLSAISEAMNQMMGSSATSLSQMLGRKIDISPPVASLIDLNDGVVNPDKTLSTFLTETFVKVTFKMQIGDLIDSEIMQLYPMDLAKEIFEVFTASMQTTEEPAAPEPAAPPQMEQPQPAPSQPQMAQAPAGQPPMMDPSMMGQMPYGYGMPMGQPMMPPPNVNAQPVQFQPFANMPNPITQQENIDLIMDVPLDVTVELGRTKKSIKEILEISPGTIIELDKLAGEPVDVIVNGKFVAKGEVVVIEESFGVRVTEIIKDK
ncbi:MAG: flagellar motor switch phosphatase FliY [Lachnospira sp.]|nr:flagellar motor switch phosphatase FliY [Lachnospira sp.]